MNDANVIDAQFRGQLGRFALDAAFCIPAKGVTGIFGPSGSGKTSLLRCIAGLARLSGRLSVAGDVWQDDAAGLFKKPHQRAAGYVFQEASLFAHLSVRENLLFGAKRAAKQGAAPFFKLDDIVDMTSLAPLLNRAPAALSGGERQRVAIGRALMAQPRLLLFDEPLSALDRPSREELFPYLETLHEALSIPILYVSHDMSEIERLADTLLLVEKGCIIAAGPLSRLQADPALPLMNAAHAAVTLTGKTVGIDEAYGLIQIAVAGGRLTIPARRATIGEERRLSIKASDVSFTLAHVEATSILNRLPVKIVAIDALPGDSAHVNIVAALGEDGAGARIVGRVTRKSRDALGLAPGASAFAQIKSIALAP